MEKQPKFDYSDITSNSQLIRLLEPIYLLRVREASD